MCFVYILKSEKNNKYYTGFTTKSIEERLMEHNEGKFSNSFTLSNRPWSIFHFFPCENSEIAKKIERHIKKMKSRKYIENLKEYSELQDKLLERFKTTTIS
jgi:putative endonuclease